MSFRNQASQPPGSRSNSIARSGSMLVIAGTLAVMLILAVVFAAAAVGFGNQATVLRTIRVPGDLPTVQAAIDAAKPGDIVRVESGTYLENLVLDKPITLTARTFDDINPVNNATILDGGGGGPTIMIPAGMTQMATIRGFVLRNGSSGVQADSPFIAESNYMLGSAILADYLVGAGGINRGNVYFGAAEAAVRIAGPNRPLLLENNRIFYSAGNGLEIDLQTAEYPPALTDIDIWNNMIVGSKGDGIQFIDHGTAPQDANRRFRITGNLIAKNRHAGIGAVSGAAEDYSGADLAEPAYVYNNTIYGNDYGLSGGDNTVAFNNIITKSSTRGTWKLQGGEGSDSVVAYTLFFENGIDTDQTNTGVGNISGMNPLFMALPNAGPDGVWETVDDDFGGLLLEAASPAIDRGVAQYVSPRGVPIPETPLTGFAGAAPDLGWREYGSPIFMTATPSMTPLPTVLLTETPLSPTALPTTSTPAVGTATGTAESPTAAPSTPTEGSPLPAPTATGEATKPPTETLAINAIDPTSAAAGSVLDVAVSGSGFQVGATVVFQGGKGPAPSVTNVVVVDATTLIVTVQTASGGGESTVWDILVSNPNGTNAVLPKAFTVTP